MPKFKNVSGEDLHVFYPSGHPESLLVEAGQLMDVPGEAVEAGDAYLVGVGDNARAYPVAQWELVAPRKSSGKAEGAVPDSEKE